MTLDGSKLVRQPQTYLLLLGTALGYAVFMALAGPRPLAWISGGGIAAAMIGTWTAGFRERTLTQSESSNLLNAIAFQQQIQSLDSKVPNPNNPTWQQVRTWASESHRSAAGIFERDSLFQVDLLEALHTVVDLARQVAEALQVMDQIQTPMYRQMAQERLQASCDRMQETHAQLQQLQDQVALSSLDPGDPATNLLPQRLQTLIMANKQILDSSENG